MAKRCRIGSNSGISNRLHREKSNEVASRDINRAFQRMMEASPTCNYAALRIAINVDGDTDEIRTAYLNAKRELES